MTRPRSASARRSRRERSSNRSAVTTADATLKGRVGDPFSSPWRRRLPLLPALLFAIAVTQLPFLVSIYYSFTNLKDRTQSLIPEPTKFVGFGNYRAIFDDPFFRQAMWTSVKMTVLAVVLSLVFGTLFAMLLDRKFFGQGLIRTLLITPFLMLIMLAGLQSQPADILEAAEVDGASAFSVFRQLTLPHLRRYLELGALLGSIYIIQ